MMTTMSSAPARSSAESCASSPPEATPWMWTLTYGYREDRSPADGYEPTREAAMQAFARSWHRE
jgi:hypothetical protein